MSYWNNSFFGRDHSWETSAGEVLESYKGLNQGLDSGNCYTIWINAVTLLLQLLTSYLFFSKKSNLADPKNKDANLQARVYQSSSQLCASWKLIA